METKICSKCKIQKSINEFHFKKTEGRYNSWCKECLYILQKNRWKDRKRKAIELFGGKCCKCGYNKNLAALCFHHRDPTIKEYNWLKLRLFSWEIIIKELKKCDLLCNNCHAELHWPEQNLILKDSGTSNSRLNHEQKQFEPTGVCPSCSKNVYGTKYCSVECACHGHRKVIRPSKIELDSLIKNTSIYAVSKKYGVSWTAVKKWVKQYQKTNVPVAQ